MEQWRIDVVKGDQVQVQVDASEIKEFLGGVVPDGPASASAIVNIKIFKERERV